MGIQLRAPDSISHFWLLCSLGLEESKWLMLAFYPPFPYIRTKDPCGKRISYLFYRPFFYLSPYRPTTGAILSGKKRGNTKMVELLVCSPSQVPKGGSSLGVHYYLVLALTMAPTLTLT